MGARRLRNARLLLEGEGFEREGFCRAPHHQSCNCRGTRGSFDFCEVCQISMALAARRHGSRLASQTLKSLSGFLNTEEKSASQSACSGLVQPQPQTDPLKKALLRGFWAGSWRTSTVPGCTVQQQSYSSIVYPPVEAKVGKAAPDFTAPGMFPRFQRTDHSPHLTRSGVKITI